MLHKFPTLRTKVSFFACQGPAQPAASPREPEGVGLLGPADRCQAVCRGPGLAEVAPAGAQVRLPPLDAHALNLCAEGLLAALRLSLARLAS